MVLILKSGMVVYPELRLLYVMISSVSTSVKGKFRTRLRVVFFCPQFGHVLRDVELLE